MEFRVSVYLAVRRLVHMVHSASLGERLKCWKVEPFDLLVGDGEEVVLEDEVHLFEAGRPVEHTNF